MYKENRDLSEVFIRYIIILIAGLKNLFIFYKILTPITIGVLVFSLGIFTEVSVTENIITLNWVDIEIIPACIAGAAFYLLFILIFSTGGIKPKERFKILIVSFATLLILNVLRIIFLILIAEEPYFLIAHWVFWHLISTVFVIGIWIGIVKLYKIKGVPIYSDFMDIKRLVKPIKKTKRKKKN
jgi:exosortase/archaeosortase family protein